MLEHSIKSTTDRSTAVRKWSKPVIALVGSLVLFSTGSAAYFFSEWLTIPGLKTQVQKLEDQVLQLTMNIDELTVQVDRLEDQVDRLGGQVQKLENETDRFESLNDELQLTLGNYTDQNDALNASLAIFAELNAQFNETVVALRVEVSALEVQVDRYNELNDDLNQTAISLSSKVAQLEGVNQELSDTNQELWDTVEVLSNETIELSLINQDLQDQKMLLEEEIDEMGTEVDRLESLSKNLATVVSFLNATTVAIDQTVDRFTDFLAREIRRTRVMAMDSLRNNYQQSESFWNCDFREYFLGEPFVQNRNSPIGDEAFPEVLAYIDERVLSTMCLDVNDFLAFLRIGSSVSFNDLLQTVGDYTDLAMLHYFPPNEETAQRNGGLDPDMWAEARHSCTNLQQSSLFRFER